MRESQLEHRHDDRLSAERGKSVRQATGPAASARSPEQRRTLRDHVRQIRFSRDLRGKFFDRNIFGEPAWDILLTLYTIDDERRRLNTRELAKVSRLALTTALRWLDFLKEQDLIERKSNPFDQRMVYVELSDKGRAAIDDYLLQMREAEMFGTGDSSEN